MASPTRNQLLAALKEADRREERLLKRVSDLRKGVESVIASDPLTPGLFKMRLKEALSSVAGPKRPTPEEET